ncbi:hypothetical protein ACGFIE_06940 [Micromonospora sp. NPDC049275]|uniref:hypothetical protein n=1 Tax=Micromonospora sp. NPDC049275 TaxID=3364268 RepID=UPI00371D06B0
MTDPEDRAPDELLAAVIGRTLTVGAGASAVLLVVALTGPETTATAAVAAVGTIVTALVGLAADHPRRNDRQ